MKAIFLIYEKHDPKLRYVFCLIKVILLRHRDPMVNHHHQNHTTIILGLGVILRAGSS